MLIMFDKTLCKFGRQEGGGMDGLMAKAPACFSGTTGRRDEGIKTINKKSP